MDKRLHELADLLLAIEAELRRLSLWDSAPPAPEALQNVEPFCVDTLSFAQWLQWILLPRTKTIIEQQQALPAVSDILPMAEYCLEALPQDTCQLLDLIDRFDELIGRP